MHSGASGVACLERVCGRAAPDAPERVYDQRRCTGCQPSDVLPRNARERVPTILVFAFQLRNLDLNFDVFRIRKLCCEEYGSSVLHLSRSASDWLGTGASSMKGEFSQHGSKSATTPRTMR